MALECFKAQYTLSEAQSLKRELLGNKRIRKQRHIKHLRIYRCDICRHWHLTSQNKR